MASFRGILPTKLHHRQTRPRIVERPRLVEALERCAALPLTLVQAPAGSGKSTAVVAWLEHTRLPVAWLSLDPGDDSPMRFLAYLLAAVHGVEPRVGADVDAAEILAAPMVEELESALAELLVIPLVARSEPLVLVLDDVHLLSDARILAGLSWLLDNAPACLRLILISRSEPALPLARLRASGGLGEIGVEALRFSLAEAGDFYGEIMGLALTPARLEELEAVNEGWPVGAALTALSLRTGAHPGGQGRAVSLPRGDDRLIADYLMSEVLEGLDPALRELAVAAAVPERICGSLATALLDQQQEQPEATLAAVERANLFLLPLDAHGRWFRYHHLFRDFLLRRASERGEDWLRARHLRAAQWLAARDLRQEAFEHALAAGELGLITGLFEAWSAELLAGSRTGLVRDWLARLPAVLRTQRAAPLFMDGWCDVIVGRLRSAGDKLDQAEALLGAEDTPLTHALIQGMGPLLREACLLRAGRYAEAEAMAAAWRARIPSEGPRELRLTHASHLLHEGLAALEAGDAERAAARLEGIEPLMRGDPAFVVVPLAHLAEARRRLGALDEAERCARRALAYAEESDSAGLSPAGLARVALGAVALDRDQPERALEEALAGVERLELLFDVAYLVRGAEVLARARMACGAEAEAIEGLDDFLLLLEGTDMRPAIGHLQALRGELARPGHTERPPGSESLAVTVEPLATYEALTSRELEVLKLAAEGGSNRDIAKALFVSVGTVKTHMHRILAKLDVPNRTRAIHRARRAGLL